MRKISAIVTFGLMAALIGAACTPNGPAPSQWKVSAKSITVHDSEDNDGGDEPYVMQLGFRSKLGVDGSSKSTFASQCYTRKLPANNAAPSGTTIEVPAGAADILLPNVQNLDVGDLALGTAPFEIIGTLSFVAERDGVFPDSCAVSDALKSLLGPVLEDALELFIAESPTPPTTEDLIQLIVDNIGNFLSGLGSMIGSVIEGLGNPDDIIGIAAQIHLPTSGALTDLIKTGLAIGGLFQPGLEQGFIPIEGLPSSLLIKVGPLVSSSSTFRFDTAVADYSYVSKISR
ncbi:MAG: hypothetical protein ACYC2O_02000 [Microthrixaceae bacterium]